ncbi:MAG TPA: hypothetical protein VFR08_04830 [Candidatus Angelobacter sp.]|nr:hypothetical protein [Candidatus Angelobacter sp.]
MKFRITKQTLFTALVAFAFVGLAVAASVHFKSGPTFFDQGLTLNASGALAGLGNGDVLVHLSATARPTATCTNSGGNEAPGQNPASVNVTGAEAIPNTQIKNGTTPFTVTTNAPAQPTPEEAGCPNDNWKAAITDLQFTSATITVFQNNVAVLTATFNLSCPPATTNDGIGQCTII